MMVASTAESRQDFYPTRYVAESVARPRMHKTVWGDPGSGPLGADQLEAYDRDGFLAFDCLFSPEEMGQFREELQRLTVEENLRGSDRLAPEPDSDGLRSIFEVHVLSDVFADLVRSDRLTAIARQILGSDVYVHQSRVNYKSAFSGSKWGWHSDFETWHAEDGMPAPHALSFTIALTENYPFNGPLMIIPGSHLSFISTVGETPPDYHKISLLGKSLPAGPVDRAHVTALAKRRGIRQFTGAPGSAVVFDCNCLHASSENITPFARSNFFIVYNSMENVIGDPYAAPGPRPQYLANRDFTPLR